MAFTGIANNNDTTISRVDIQHHGIRHTNVDDVFFENIKRVDEAIGDNSLQHLLNPVPFYSHSSSSGINYDINHTPDFPPSGTVSFFSQVKVASHTYNNNEQLYYKRGKSVTSYPEIALEYVRKIYIFEQVGDTVLNIARATNAAYGMEATAYVNIELDENEMFDEDANFQSYSSGLHAPTLIRQDYDGFITLGWEAGDMAEALEDPSSELHETAVDDFLKCLRAAKAFWPNAKIGFYGFPTDRYYQINGIDGTYAQWIDRQDGMQRLFNECGALFPSVYEEYHPDQTGTLDGTYTRAARVVSQALRQAKDKPVLPFMWHRVKEANTDGYAWVLVPDVHWQRILQIIMDQRPYGKGIDGIVWWGANTVHKQAYLAGVPSGIVPVWDAELPSGVTRDPNWFNMMHLHYLRLTLEKLNNINYDAPATSAEWFDPTGESEVFP